LELFRYARGGGAIHRISETASRLVAIQDSMLLTSRLSNAEANVHGIVRQANEIH